eukprot:Phypoly_transcript_01146.p1 GENE.Phypoly_transcript_01146~~Phypoly_transcript_01146.p1  ORF type:complete len:545 (+),score=83.59 Phypoly_transcript_01146:1989-3623(+)
MGVIGQFDDAFNSKYQSQLDEAAKLLDIEDPESEPYKSKYQATNILKGILDELKQQLEGQHTDEEKKSLQTNKAILQLKLGALYVETEEMFHGEHSLNDALAALELISSERPLETLDCLNQLGILWNNRTDYNQSEKYLKKAEELYDKIDLAKFDETTREKIEDQHTLTLFYLAQMYGYCKKTLESATYCRKTLQRQLKSKKYVPEEFVSHCLSLSGFYDSENMLDHVRQCVEAAMIVYQENPDKIQDREQLDGNLASIWGKYFLAHLQNAKKAKEGAEIQVFPKEVLFEEFVDRHPKLDFDTTVPDQITNFADAKSLFLRSMQCLNKAKQYFVLDGFVSDHFNILHDMSSLYGALAAFETDPDRICKMTRRRIDLLEPVIAQLSPQHFEFLLMQNTFRLGELYSDLADMKIKILEQTQNATGHQVKKINELLNKSISFFTKFLKMFEVKDKEPEKIDPDQLEAYFMARFSLARLYSRLISDHPEILVKTLKQSLAQYEWVVNYAEKHPEASAYEAEVSVCRQMASLLPMKIQNIARSARNVGE